MINGKILATISQLFSFSSCLPIFVLYFYRILFFFVKNIPSILFGIIAFFLFRSTAILLKIFLAHLDHEEINQNSLICTSLPHLSQQVIDLHTSLTSLMTEGFLKQKELFSQVKDKVDDFLTGKVTFTLTATKTRPRPQGKSSIPLDMLDPILHSPMADVPAFSSTPIDNRLSPFRSLDLTALIPGLDG